MEPSASELKRGRQSRGSSSNDDDVAWHRLLDADEIELKEKAGEDARRKQIQNRRIQSFI
jgi:hypothetical protein